MADPPQADRLIAAKLDAVLDKVDACQQRLAKIPVILKRFRQGAASRAPTQTLPLVAEMPASYGRNIPQAILAHMQPRVEYSRADLVDALGLSTSDWNWAIRQLKEEGKVVQTGERRGARYIKT